MTVGAIMQAYIADRKTEVASPGAIENAWKAMQPHFANILPENIAESTCKDYFRKRTAQNIKSPNPRAPKRKIKPATVRQELGVLRTALRWAAEKKDWLPRAPHIWKPKATVGRTRHLTADEFDRLLEQCTTPHVRLYALLALCTAGRMAALLDLTWDRVDFERDLIYLESPEQHSRAKGRATVPMIGALRSELEKAKEASVSEYVIEWGGGRVADVGKALGEAVRRARLKGVTAHTLRHTAATWIAEETGDLERAAKYLGHSDPSTARKHYAHLGPDFLRSAAAAIERRLK